MRLGGDIRSRVAALPPADKYTVWVVLMLSAVGVVAVYSAISFLAEVRSGGDTERFLLKHVTRVVLALGVMSLFSVINYQTLARFSRIALLGSIALLVVVQVVGVASGGAARWLKVGALGFQPSDLTRVALILYVGVLLAKKQFYITSFSRAFVPIFVWILPAVVLIGIEDLSTAIILLVSTSLMCFAGRVRMLHLGGLLLLAIVLAGAFLLTSPTWA